MEMAEGVPEKSRGLKFAEQQLLRHGWEHGKGLGRAENGISEAIKVKVKCDKGGVGHKEGEQFSFHWWDHVFNKASASLQVQSDQDGISLKRTAEEGEEGEEGGRISNKKPRKAALAKAKLYGCFVKSSTLLSGQERPEPKAFSSDSSSSDEEQKLDLSSTTKLSDSDLMRACGGRTAHKGARHGLTMSAKLARLEQQEAQFMARYGGGSQGAPPTPPQEPSTPPTPQQGATEDSSRKEKKKKKKKAREDASELGEEEEEMERTETESKIKKKKKKRKAGGGACDGGGACGACDGGGACNGGGEQDSEPQKKKKKKKKKKSARADSGEVEEEGEEKGEEKGEEEGEGGGHRVGPHGAGR
ncbi:G patch domain-containing protein 4 [Menidia menidia]